MLNQKVVKELCLKIGALVPTLDLNIDEISKWSRVQRSDLDDAGSIYIYPIQSRPVYSIIPIF